MDCSNRLLTLLPERVASLLADQGNKWLSLMHEDRWRLSQGSFSSLDSVFPHRGTHSREMALSSSLPHSAFSVEEE